MADALGDIRAVNGDVVAAEHIRTALTAGSFVYADGSTQIFGATGATTYVEQNIPTEGQWFLGDDGRFCSFWPPDYRACYDLYWIVEEDRIAGIRFVGDGRRSGFSGRYR